MLPCLITRTQPGADQTAERVTALGLSPIICPAAEIIATEAALYLDGVQALLMTSAAAARSVTLTDVAKAIPVYAVGDATAEAALLAGFETVVSAGGDASALAVLAADRLKPLDGALLHLRGGEIAGDVSAMLIACGFEARSVEVYRTQDHPAFAQVLADTVRAHTNGIVLLHSPAGARRFEAAATRLGLTMKAWAAIGLSKACLEPLEHMGFSYRAHAYRPDEASLLTALVDATQNTVWQA